MSTDPRTPFQRFVGGSAIAELAEFDAEFLRRHKARDNTEWFALELQRRFNVTYSDARERLSNVIGIDWYENVVG